VLYAHSIVPNSTTLDDFEGSLCTLLALFRIRRHFYHSVLFIATRNEVMFVYLLHT